MEQKASASQIGVRAGLVLGLVLCLQTAIFGVMGYVGSQSLSFVISLVVWIGAIYWGMNEFKKNNEGTMSLGQGVGIGTLAVVVGSAISLIFLYVYVFYLDPSYFDLILENSREQMIARGMPDEQIDAAIAQTGNFFWIGLVFLFFANALVGAIVSLIMSAVLQQKPTEQNQDSFG